MKDPRDIIKRPVITERSMEIMAEKKYMFEVDVRANKTEIKEAIEAIFRVKVDKVNIMNYKPKAKTRMVNTLVILAVVEKQSLS